MYWILFWKNLFTYYENWCLEISPFSKLQITIPTLISIIVASNSDKEVTILIYLKYCPVDLISSQWKKQRSLMKMWKVAFIIQKNVNETQGDYYRNLNTLSRDSTLRCALLLHVGEWWTCPDEK